MTKFACEYCGVYLTHDSASGRRQHNKGKKHQENVRVYYEKLIENNETNGVEPLTEIGTTLPTTASGQQLPASGLHVLQFKPQPSMLHYTLPQFSSHMIARPP